MLSVSLQHAQLVESFSPILYSNIPVGYILWIIFHCNSLRRSSFVLKKAADHIAGESVSPIFFSQIFTQEGSEQADNASFFFF